MRSAVQKLLHPLCGRPIIEWSVAAARDAGAAKIVVVDGPDRRLASTLNGAVSLAVRIRERIAEHEFLKSDGLSVALTASVGVATLPDVAGSAEELIRAADMAMYKVKEAGKNGIHVATAED